MRRCSLPFPASLPCSASGVEDRKWGCKTSKNPWKENKGLRWLFKITSKVIINESSGKGAVFQLPAQREVCCRFAALTPFLCVGISFPHTWAWHQTPLQQLTAVTSRMLTWRIAEKCSLWLKKKIKIKNKKKRRKGKKGHFPVNFPWRSKLRDVPWWRHWQHQNHTAPL